MLTSFYQRRKKQKQNDEEIDVLLTWPSDGLRLFESMQPLGLASIAAVIQQAGYRVKIIDFNHYKKDFRLDLLRLKPKVVGIGGTTATRKSSFYTAALVKEVLPEIQVVYGGPHATFTAEDTLQNVLDIDYIIQGEGEFSFLKLVDHLFGKIQTTLNDIPGLAWRNPTGIQSNPPERIQDLSTLPIPSRTFFEHQYPITIDHTDIPAAILITSRGCPALCDFCSASKLFPGGVRFRDIKQVEEEVKQILQHSPHVRGLKIFDSTFTASREHVLAFCQMISKYKLLWECEVRVDTVDFSLLQQMKSAGCIYINMGLESSSPDTLKRIGKRISADQANQVLEWCMQLGILTKVFFTFGHLDQQVSEIRNDLTYMNQLKEKIDFFATTVGIRVYPGTILEKKLRKRGYFPSHFSWAKYTPPLRNYWVLEPADVMILEQKHLSLFKLGGLIPKLMINRTVLSPAYIKKHLYENIQLIPLSVGQRIRYTRQVLYRKSLMNRFWNLIH